MTRTSLARVLSFALLLAPGTVSAQATCVDGTGDMCLNVLRLARADGVVDDIFQTRDGLYAPQLSFARYIRGVNGCIGVSSNRLIYEGYTCGAAGTNPPGGNDPAFQAGSLDWYWTQIVRTHDDGTAVVDGEPGNYVPWRGRIMDIGGEANRVVLFPITDHPPLPCEAFEYTVWLSNNPDATSIAPASAPDPNQWNEARLIRAFTQGWTRNPTSEGAIDASRGDLATYLRDATTSGDAIADALATVWALPCGLSFRYVAIQGGNNGNPGPECTFHSQEDELDAVAGLNEDDTAICLDMDGDGHRAATCGGDDCDDTDAAVHPGAFEPCDSARDLDCMPAVTCPTGTSCDTTTGLCATSCFEGSCAPGFTCTDAELCTEASCAARTEPCPDGTICRAGNCVNPCDGVVCPGRLQCVEGACIDLCLGVICPSMQVCVADRPGALTLCGPGCTCLELGTSLCGEGTACDARTGSPTEGLCVDPGCEALTCGPGEVCSEGACVDGCEGVTCPIGQTCQLATCVVDRCASVTCGTGLVCRDGTCLSACDGVSCADGQRCRNGACETDPCAAVDCGPGNRCVEGSCVPDGPVDAGTSMERVDSGRGSRVVTQPGCGCRVGAGSNALAGLALLTLVVLGLVIRRARR